MNREDKILLTGLYKKYNLRDDHLSFAINNDFLFDTRRDLPVRFVKSDKLDGELAVVHADLYRITRKSLHARPVFPDDFEAIE